MTLDEVARNRQSQSEAAVQPRGSTVALTEPVEHERQQLGSDADAGVADLDGQRLAA